jgi:choline dehydrogenase-like flavoprotein
VEISLATTLASPGGNTSYDYVIVGGGTGGLALASSLAENISNTVAVIEAGGFYKIDNGNISSVPGLGLAYDPVSLLFTHTHILPWTGASSLHLKQVYRISNFTTSAEDSWGKVSNTMYRMSVLDETGVDGK